MNVDPEDILNYWFYEVGPERWFAADKAIDEAINSRYLQAYEAAAAGDLAAWEETPEGTIALLLLLDVFPRRMFRGTARAYQTDVDAMDLARRSIIRHFDDRIDKGYKLFFYLPFAHSESIGDQRLGMFYVRERTKEQSWIDEAERRFLIIQRFGRFPHRNAALGRESTPEEIEYIASLESST